MSYIKKPFTVRDTHTYNLADAILKQLLLTNPKMPNTSKWDYNYSHEKYAYEYTLDALNKECMYFRNKMKAHKYKHPEEFI